MYVVFLPIIAQVCLNFLSIYGHLWWYEILRQFKSLAKLAIQATKSARLSRKHDHIEIREEKRNTHKSWF